MADLDLEVCLSLFVAMLVVFGSARYFTGYAGLDAPRAIPTFAGRKWARTRRHLWQWHYYAGFSGFDAPRAVFPTFAGREVAELVVNSDSDLHSAGFAGISAPRAAFLMIAGRPSWFRLATWSRLWHRATDHGGKHAFLPGVQLWTRSLTFLLCNDRCLGFV